MGEILALTFPMYSLLDCFFEGCDMPSERLPNWIKKLPRWLLNATFTHVIDSNSDPQPLDDDPRPDLPRELVQREERPANLFGSPITKRDEAVLKIR